VKSNKVVKCPCCQGLKIVCNGVKKNGRQNYKCKDCGRQFQMLYDYPGCQPENRQLALRCLCRGSGIRDCSVISKLSCGAVLRLIKKEAAALSVKPRLWHYKSVQIDEQWSYVGKKEKKVWMLYAYAVEEDEILAFTLGKRSARTVANLLVKLKQLTIDCFLTDDWEAFKAVLPAQKHKSGKQYTKNIEGINTFFRTRVRRLMRRTVCFSKKLIYHYSMLKIIIHLRNNRPSYF
jgi:insertion element IS1 protein InsB